MDTIAAKDKKTQTMKILRQILLTATTVSLTLTALQAPMASAKVVPLDRVVAVVDNDVIMASELDKRLQTVRQQLQERSSNLPSEQVLKQQVLERLIIENLQLQLANRSGTRIDDSSLNEAITNIAARNGMTLSQFQQVLKQDGVSYAEIRDQIRREMLINRVRQRLVMERIQVSDREVENFRSSAEGKQRLAVEYRLGHILVALPDGASPQQIATAQKTAEKIYNDLQRGADFTQIAISQSQGQNALEGGDLGWRTADQLPTIFAEAATDLEKGQISRPIRSPSGFHILKMTDSRGNEKLLQEQVKARHILIKPNEVRSDMEAEQIARSIYNRLKKGEPFSELAKAYSDDPGSALNGGDLGWADPREMVPAFRDKMLTQPINTLTQPFRSPFGWHIMEVQGKRQEDVSELVRTAQIREIIGQRKFEEELQVWLRELRDQAFVDIKL